MMRLAQCSQSMSVLNTVVTVDTFFASFAAAEPVPSPNAAMRQTNKIFFILVSCWF